MINRNLIILSLAQVFSFTAAPITVFLSGIISINMVNIKSLATLPSALMIVGTALGSILASYTMSLIGRKYGFMIASILLSLSALIASYSVFNNFFMLFCFSNFLIGICHAFTSQYRFAAAENVKKKFIPSAISIILFASMAGALIGPNIATLAKDIIPQRMYTGSYILLSALTFLPFFFFIFYSEKKSQIKFNGSKNSIRGFYELICQPKFFQAIIASGIAYCIMSFLMTATPIAMHINNNLSIGKTGFVIMFHILAMFFPSLLTGYLINKFGHNKIMYSGVLVLFFSIFFNFINQSFYNYLFGLILLGIGWNLLFISGSSLLISSYQPEEKFKAQGLNDFIVYTTQAIGALSAGFLLNVFGWQFINILCLPLLLIIIFTVFVANKKINAHSKL